MIEISLTEFNEDYEAYLDKADGGVMLIICTEEGKRYILKAVDPPLSQSDS